MRPHESMSHSIAKNTLFMTSASILQKVISFGYFTLIARLVGVTGTGKYFLALSFTTIFVIFVDLGLTNVLVREGAKAKDKIQEYLSTVLSVKFVLGLITYLSLVITVQLLGYDSELRAMIYLSGITMLFDSTHLSLYGTLRALGDLRYEAVSIPASQFLTLLLGSIFLWLHLPLIFLMLAFTIPSMINVCFATVCIYKKHGIRFRLQYHRHVAKIFLKIAIPFALAAVFARVYGYIDSILLSKLASHEAVGWYSVPYKITFAFQFIPLALVAALYPRLSEYYATDKSKLMTTLASGLKYLFLASFPIVVGIAILAKPIIVLLYGQPYIPSIVPLQILIVSLLFSFASFPLGAFLNATNRQAMQTTIVGTVMVINIISNVLLIPYLGATGAAVSACAGNFLLALLGYIVASRVAILPHRIIWGDILRIGVAAGVMGISVFLLLPYTPLIPTIFISGGIYVLFLFVTKALSVEDIAEARQFLRK